MSFVALVITIFNDYTLFACTTHHYDHYPNRVTVFGSATILEWQIRVTYFSNGTCIISKMELLNIYNETYITTKITV